MTLSSAGPRAGRQTPTKHIRPTIAFSEGDDAVALAARYGIVVQPWQRLVIHDWLAYNDQDLFAATTCGLAVPRQNGKNVCLLVRELFGAVVLGERIVHTAHDRSTAIEHFRELLNLFGDKPGDRNAQFPDLNKRCRNIRRTTGDEGIYLLNGGCIRLGSRSKRLRGRTNDVVVADEAQELSESALAALSPLNSSARSGNPQKIFCGTPPTPGMTSDVWRRIRSKALDGKPNRSWAEWGYEGDLDGLDTDDDGLIAEFNPGLPEHPLWVSVADERDSMSRADYARERMGWWGPDDGAQDAEASLIDVDEWAKHVASTPDGVKPHSIGVDMSHARLLAIAMCVLRQDGTAHIEIVSDTVSDPMDSLDWLMERTARKGIPVVIDKYSPASSLIAPLRAAGVLVNHVASWPDMATACGLFFDEVNAGRITHGNQPQFTASLLGAKKRFVQDAGGFALNRKNTDSDIAPAVAAVLARYGASQVKPKTGLGRVDSGNRKGFVG